MEFYLILNSLFEGAFCFYTLEGKPKPVRRLELELNNFVLCPILNTRAAYHV